MKLLPTNGRRCLLAGLLAAGFGLAAVSPAHAFVWGGWPSNKTTGGGGSGGGGSGGGSGPGGGGGGGGSGGGGGGGGGGGEGGSGGSGGSGGWSGETSSGGSAEGGSESLPSPEAPEPSTLVLGLLGLGSAWVLRKNGTRI